MKEQIEKLLKELIDFAKHADVGTITDYIMNQLSYDEKQECIADIRDMINLLTQ